MSQVRIGVCTLTSGTAKEVGDQAQEGMLSVFRSQPGFKAYELAETQGGKIVSVSLWESGDQAQKANDLAASWVKDNLADRVRLESSHVGDFLFYGGHRLRGISAGRALGAAGRAYGKEKAYGSIP
jgi:heme-degrading monooxygenase HmoA